MSILASTIPILLMFGLLFWTRITSPTWIKYEGKTTQEYWKKWNIIAFVFSVIMIGVFSFFLDDSFYEKTIHLSAIGFLSYTLIQSVHTDFSYRLVDRKILILGMFLFIVPNILALVELGQPMILVFLCLIAACFVLFLISSIKIGQSDIRALLLVIITTFPIIGTKGIVYFIVLFLVVILVYAIFYSLFETHRNKEGVKEFFDLLMMKLSIPAVPFLLFSALLIYCVFLLV